MDYPQWYNNKLWNATRQSIDGNIQPKFNQAYRCQSANSFGNKRSFNPMNYPLENHNNSYAYRLQGNPSNVYNRDKSSSYPYQSSNRSNLKSAQTFRNNYFNKLYTSVPVNYARSFGVNNNNYNNSSNNSVSKSNSSVLSLSGKQFPINEPGMNSSKPIEIKILNKAIITPSFTDPYDNPNYSLLPTKNDIIKGNLNSKRPVNEDSNHTESDQEQDQNKTTNENITKVPENTPRIPIDSSSHTNSITVPIKSILKKTSYNPNQNNFPTQNGFINIPVVTNKVSRIRTLSASSINYKNSTFNTNSPTSLVSSKYNLSPHLLINPTEPFMNTNYITKTNNLTNNDTTNMRKSLQSAPQKRAVRFNMTANDILEYH